MSSDIRVQMGAEKEQKNMMKRHYRMRMACIRRDEDAADECRVRLECRE